MIKMTQFLDSHVLPDNVRFVSLVPEEYVPALLRGEMPRMPRIIRLEMNKRGLRHTTTTWEFKALKDAIRKKCEELTQIHDKQMPEVITNINMSAKTQSGESPPPRLNSFVQLPPHEEGDRSIATSFYANVTENTADGTTLNSLGIATTTLLDVRGKVLIIQVTGGANDLEWSRQRSKEWASAILADNPSTGAIAAEEAMQPNPHTWRDNLLRNVIIAAAVGAIVLLIRYRNWGRLST